MQDFDENKHKKAAISFARCEALTDEAIAAETRGEPLLAANKYLDAVFAARGTYRQDRLHCWQKYEGIMTSQFMFYKTMSVDEVKKVTILAEDEKELAIFRISAYYVLGMNYWAQDQLDQAAKCHRSALDAIEFARARGRGKGPCPPGSITEWDVIIYEYAADGVTEVPVTMTTFIDRMEDKVKLGLSLGQNATNIDFLRNGMKSRWGTDESLIERMGAGGAKCDCCGEKAEKMESGELLQCSRCQQAYYCSVTCQKRQWKAGHKQACRKPDQVERGDIMLVKGIASKPELNRKLVKIIRAANGEGRWEVSFQGTNNNNISLSSKNLVHIRPAK